MSLRTFLGILEGTSPEWFAQRAGECCAAGQTLESELFTVLAMEKGKLSREIRAGAAVIEIDARDLTAIRRDLARRKALTQVTENRDILPWAVGRTGELLHAGTTIADALDCAATCSLIEYVNAERRGW